MALRAQEMRLLAAQPEGQKAKEAMYNVSPVYGFNRVTLTIW